MSVTITPVYEDARTSRPYCITVRAGRIAQVFRFYRRDEAEAFHAELTVRSAT